MKRLMPAWLLVGLAASTTMAQDTAPDWEIVSDPAKSATAAVVAFDSGIGIGVRCLRGALGVVISGLPPEQAPNRTLRIAYDADPLRDTRWVTTTNPTVVVHEYPAAVARRLRLGGQMTMVVPGAGEGGRNLRYILDLPASATAIESVLTSCNKPLIDPRDAELDIRGPAEGLPQDMRWVRPPRPLYPHEAEFDRVARGYAVLTCLTQADGSLKACEVESEHPLGSGFGRASLAAIPRARLGWVAAPDTPADVRRIAFRVNFAMAN